MTEELATNLRLQRYPHVVSLNGLGKQVHSKYYVITTLLSSSRSYSTQPITFAVVPHLVCTTVPEDKDEILASATLQNASLADPELGGRVDVFLGNLDLEDIVLSTYKDGKLRIIATPFGISVAGPISKGSSSTLAVTSAVPDDLQNNLSRLWELDRVPEAPTQSPDDAKVLEHFNNTVRTVNGRISVTLHMETDPPPLGDSRRQAMSRLFANEKSLSSKDKLDAFNVVLREYLSLGHAHLIPHDELDVKPHFYLPVHGVFKDSSATTKVRAVFDASARSTTGTSLNDLLLPGPNLYPSLPDVLIRFRRHAVGFSVGISKMFSTLLTLPVVESVLRTWLPPPCGGQDPRGLLCPLTSGLLTSSPNRKKPLNVSLSLPPMP